MGEGQTKLRLKINQKWDFFILPRLGSKARVGATHVGF